MEERKISTANDIHLSPIVLAALDCRAGDIVVITYHAKCIEVRKKEND